MGLHNRPYMESSSGHDRSRGTSFGLPPAGRVVKYLLVINLVVFAIQIFVDHAKLTEAAYQSGAMSRWLGVTVGQWWQVWRYLTFQFLHDPGSYWHILLNMLALYILGSPLEQLWGPRKFLTYYLTCGVVAGAAYVVIGSVFNLPTDIPIIGASGGVYGLMLAAAIYLPHIQIIFLFFPVPIRLAALIMFAGMVIMVGRAMASALGVEGELRGYHIADAMSDVAHLGGAIAGAVWLVVAPRVQTARIRHLISRPSNRGAWQRRMQKLAGEQAEIDRILQKIHDHGLGSLTHKEKKELRDATRRQQSEDRETSKL